MALLVAAVAFCLSVLFFCISFEFPHLAADPGGPALYPRIVAVITAIASVLYGIQHLSSHRPAAQAKKESRTIADWCSTALANKIKILTFILVILLPAGINFIGFVPATFLFVALLMLLTGVNLVRSLITAALSCAGVYAGYAWLLGAVLPTGTLLRLIQ